MSEIQRYVLVGRDGTEEDYEYSEYTEAYESANRRNMAVVARVYVYEDSELIWTPDGSDAWPPTTRKGLTP
jgi:hypothetical protein